MKKVFFITAVYLFTVLTTFSHAADQKLVSEEQFIKILGGEMLVVQEPVKTRSLGGKRRTIRVKQKQLSVTINFKFNLTELADDHSYRQLKAFGKALSSAKLKHITVEIGGHTDSSGSAEYNLKLSQRREQRIKNDLVGLYGISPGKLIARGYGEEMSVANNTTDEGRAMNRRVVIKRVK